MKYFFQPWMHLIQINRLEGNIYDAFDKLNMLNLHQHPDMYIGENKILRKKLFQALDQDAVLYNSIMSQSILEQIYLHLEGQQYQKLISFIETKNDLLNRIVIQEAQIIAYANMGKVQQAFHVLSKNCIHNHPVLNLRELELKLSLGDDKDVIETLGLLYKTSWSLINPNSVSLEKILFLLHAAAMMQMAGLIMQAISLTYFCLEASDRMGDEVLQANSLIWLHAWVIDTQERKKIEDLMISLYFTTQ